jgi:integrase
MVTKGRYRICLSLLGRKTIRTVCRPDASGMRIGEAINLDRDDIDWTEGVLRIRESKFGKSRLMPQQTSTMKALRDYDLLRDEAIPRPRDPSSSCHGPESD